jgi:uncharacterized protein (TIGR02231 family)
MHSIIISLIKWISATTVLIFFFPSITFSEPQEVILFPNSAHIVEVTKIKPRSAGNDLKKAVFMIPGQADPASLTTRLGEGSHAKIEDQSMLQIFNQENEKIAKLRHSLEKLKDERKQIQSTIRSLDAQIQFWQLQTKAKVKTPADAHTMAATIGKNIKRDYREKLSQESLLEKLDKRITTLQEEIDRAAGTKESAWEVTLHLSGSRNSEETVTYSYSLMGCGWLPLYRLEAKPKDKQITFSWEAEIWQSSGQDWDTVNISLATLKPSASIIPADLSPWVIKPRSMQRRKASKKAHKTEVDSDTPEKALSAEAPVMEPQQIRQSTYSLWKIGTKNIPAGTKQRVKIQHEIWPAEFAHLARPSQNNQVFIKASVNLAEAREIPPGNALFIVDGAILGKREFALAGRESAIFFGIDPLVTANFHLLSEKSGEKTFLQDRQTFTWHWRTDIQNSRTSPIKVHVEEPNPQPQDERIMISMKNDPEPGEKTSSSLIWNIDLGEGQKKSLFTTVSIEAPKNMNIDLGWRK